MSTELYLVCHECRASLWLASASGFHGVRLMGDQTAREPLRSWMEFHETLPEHRMAVLTEHNDLIEEYRDWAGERPL